MNPGTRGDAASRDALKACSMMSLCRVRYPSPVGRIDRTVQLHLGHTAGQAGILVILHQSASPLGHAWKPDPGHIPGAAFPVSPGPPRDGLSRSPSVQRRRSNAGWESARPTSRGDCQPPIIISSVKPLNISSVRPFPATGDAEPNSPVDTLPKPGRLVVAPSKPPPALIMPAV